MVKINISSSQNEKKQLQGSSTLIFCIHRDRLPVTVLCIWSASFAVSSGKLYLLQERKIPPLVGKCVGFSSPSCQLCALYPTAFLRTFLAPVQDVIYVHHTAQLLLLLVLSNFSQKHYYIFYSHLGFCPTLLMLIITLIRSLIQLWHFMRFDFCKKYFGHYEESSIKYS